MRCRCGHENHSHKPWCSCCATPGCVRRDYRGTGCGVYGHKQCPCASFQDPTVLVEDSRYAPLRNALIGAREALQGARTGDARQLVDELPVDDPRGHMIRAMAVRADIALERIDDILRRHDDMARQREGCARD